MLFWNYFLTVRTPPGNVPKDWVRVSNPEGVHRLTEIGRLGT